MIWERERTARRLGEIITSRNFPHLAIFFGNTFFQIFFISFIWFWFFFRILFYFIDIYNRKNFQCKTFSRYFLKQLWSLCLLNFVSHCNSGSPFFQLHLIAVHAEFCFILFFVIRTGECALISLKFCFILCKLICSLLCSNFKHWIVIIFLCFLDFNPFKMCLIQMLPPPPCF